MLKYMVYVLGGKDAAILVEFLNLVLAFYCYRVPMIVDQIYGQFHFSLYFYLTDYQHSISSCIVFLTFDCHTLLACNHWTY